METVNVNLALRICSNLIGSRFAVRFGDGPLLISPAMASLLRDLEGEALLRMLAAIPVQQFPAVPNIHEAVTFPVVPV